MLLLVTDTSGKDGFVGLVRANDGPQGIEVIEEMPLAGGTFSAQLIPQISSLLERHGARKSDIEAFIVVSGPGSFTGLRVGLAAIKALAEILHKPIVPVSLLEVLATAGQSVAAVHGAADGAKLSYAVALDAGRADAFVGEFELTANSKDLPRARQESLLTLDKLADLVESGNMEWVATPDPPIFDALKARFSEGKRLAIRRILRRPRSEEMVVLGVQKLKAGQTVLPEQLEANYLRRSDAEIFSKPATTL